LDGPKSFLETEKNIKPKPKTQTKKTQKNPKKPKKNPNNSKNPLG
jgi:hypothetical protein